MRYRLLQVTMIAYSLVCTSVFAVDDNIDYKQGLEFYIEGDYAKAYQHWLSAVEAKHPRAMFNLGLLHEQRRIPDASSDKADSWFDQASKHGYVAADYHLAMRWLAQGGRDEEANALIDKAANAGYAPAQQRLTGRNYPKLDSTQKITPKYLTESWIVARARSNWTIQLLAFKDRAKVESFIDQHDLRAKTAYFAELTEEGVLFKLIYGSYESKDKAEFARQNLPKSVAQNGPWLRPIESVQTVIRAQK